MYYADMVRSTKIHQELDDRDRRILSLVQRDAKLPQAEIARRVGLSTAAVNERLRKLEAAGFLRRYVAVVDPKAVGAGVAAVVGVVVEPPRHQPQFVEHLRGVGGS